MSVRAEIDERYAVAKEIFRRGDMAPEAYMRCLITFAYEHVEAGSFEDARMLLNECTDGYFERILPTQMEQDPHFAEQALLLAQKLRERGVVQVSEEDLMLAFTKTGQA